MELFNIPDNLITRRENHKETLPPYRTEFMRDRDRILYATAFRRLAGKTQIYTVGTDDHKRNRLTHTLEVAQIARTIAQGLNLNSDLAEAIALAHDFGHTPFGHAGEKMLNDIMIPESNYIKGSPFFAVKYESIEKQFEREKSDKKDYCNYAFGFKHNLQSARVAAVLEDSYLGSNGENIGLNLTNFSLYGMVVHSKLKFKENDLYPNFKNELNSLFKIKDSSVEAWSFEAYIVQWADEIAQWHHDLEDAMRGKALPINRICQTIKNSLNNHLDSASIEILDNIEKNSKMERKNIAQLSHIVVNTLVNSLIDQSIDNFKIIKHELKKKGINNPEKVFLEYDSLGLSITSNAVINIHQDINSKEFEGIIKGSVHHSRNVERMNEKGKYIIRKLFEAYYAHPQQLPDGPILHLLVDIGKYPTIDTAKQVGVGESRVFFNQIMENPDIHMKCVLMRRICDHIASMTDHYAIEEYNNLYG
ncbi:MAG: dNTP triphosphohydrolase [Clostridia bacterium]|nr:dNTP triphosphohydrolase [Clostridia bacterium]